MVNGRLLNRCHTEKFPCHLFKGCNSFMTKMCNDINFDNKFCYLTKLFIADTWRTRVVIESVRGSFWWQRWVAGWSIG